MRASDVRTNGKGAGLGAYGGQPKYPRGEWKGLVLGAGAAVALVAGVVIMTRHPPEPAPLPGVPQEVVGKNKVLLRDYADRKWLSFWKEHAEMLGDPLFSERPLGTEASCTGFVYYLVCKKSDPALQGTIWEFQPLLLGTAYLPPTLQPNDKAELAPIVQSYMVMLEQKGIDRFYFLGAVQSPAYCGQDGNCYQVFQRAVLVWASSASRPEDVQRDHLGEKAKV